MLIPTGRNWNGEEEHAAPPPSATHLPFPVEKARFLQEKNPSPPLPRNISRFLPPPPPPPGERLELRGSGHRASRFRGLLASAGRASWRNGSGPEAEARYREPGGNLSPQSPGATTPPAAS